MQWPTSGTVTSLIGWRTLNGQRKFHAGIDIGTGTGRPNVVAAYGGTVRVARDQGDGYGNKVVIDHGSGWETLYAHLHEIKTAVGASVAKNQLIGVVGNTGHSFGNHLHLEARLRGQTYEALNAAVNRRTGGAIRPGDPINVDFPGLGPAPSAGYFRGLALSPTTGQGFWLVARDGGVFTIGAADFFGSMGGQALNAPVVGIAAHPSGNGYWLVASDGGIFAYGASGFHGSMGGRPLNAPVVGIAAHPSGNGYWLVGADGGIFAYGAAGFHGSMGGRPLNAPVVGIAAHPSGNGYWLVASDGGIFAYGASGFHGSMGGRPLNAPVVGIAAHPSGNGYWLVGADGGIFAYGSAGFYGSAGGVTLRRPVVGVCATRSGAGYWLLAGDGGVFAYGDAPFIGNGLPFEP
ncbi:M23 family metallopeptidase [Actinoplanes sp. LDG1-01]|uniref:M23 family metallopeptidase n=2 Tax=Paractinoplanes lichenicola TaxID=2802976 RepID=A0ABS1VKS5_9ACTN|nr:M23 family metallopeptidase [Actinoplanes lichenicola]